MECLGAHCNNTCFEKNPPQHSPCFIPKVLCASSSTPQNGTDILIGTTGCTFEGVSSLLLPPGVESFFDWTVGG